MLDRLRQGAQGWVSKLLMVLLVLSFAVWGISGQFSGYGAGTLATVGNVEVSTAEFARRHQQLQNIAQQSGRQVSPEQVLDQMLLNAALEDEAHNYKLGVSDAHVAREIAADPRFHGQGGGFDREMFQLILDNSGLDRDDYVRETRDELLRNQIAESIATGIDVPQPIVEALYRFQNEERTVSFIVFDSSAIAPVGAPDQATLDAYFQANQERFRAPEYRRLGLLVVDPAALAAPASVTDAEVAAEYEARKVNFTQPERRRVEQLRFDTKEAAEAALRQVQSGTDFAAVAQANGKLPTEIDLGLKTKAEIIDPAVAEAAFAGQQGAVIPVIEGALEPSLIRVTAIEPGSVTPLAEVAPRLKQEIAFRAAREKVRDLYDQIEDERAGGATLEEIGKTLSLPYSVVEGVARDGTAPDGSAIADLPAKDQLLSESFESDVGVENNPIRAGEESFVFYDVLELEPARDRTFDEVKDAVTQAWTAEETQNRIAEAAEALLGRLQKGESLATIAAEIGKPVQTVEHVTRAAPPAELSANAAAQAFAGPEGHAANAESDTPPARILLKVDRVIAPAFFAEAAGVDAIKGQLAQALRNDILQSYNRQILAGRETRINNAAFAQLTGAPQAQ